MISLNENIPLYSIFALILIIGAGFLPELFPCKLQKVLKESVLLKHLIAFMTLAFFVTMTDSNLKANIKTVILKSFLAYFIFIILIKTDYRFFIVILIILCLLYLSVLKKYEIIDSIKNEKDPIIKTELEKERDMFILINNIIFICIIIILIIGYLVYMGEKKYYFKDKFNYFTFIFGKPSCAFNNSKPLTILNSLKHAF